MRSITNAYSNGTHEQECYIVLNAVSISATDLKRFSLSDDKPFSTKAFNLASVIRSAVALPVNIKATSLVSAYVSCRIV